MPARGGHDLKIAPKFWCMWTTTPLHWRNISVKQVCTGARDSWEAISPTGQKHLFATPLLTTLGKLRFQAPLAGTRGHNSKQSLQYPFLTFSHADIGNQCSSRTLWQAVCCALRSTEQSTFGWGGEKRATRCREKERKRGGQQRGQKELFQIRTRENRPVLGRVSKF